MTKKSDKKDQISFDQYNPKENIWSPMIIKYKRPWKSELLVSFGQWLLSGMKSFVYALSQMVWLFAGIFLLVFLFTKFNLTSMDSINALFHITSWVGYHFGLFFFAIWILDWWINYKEVSK